MGGVAAHPRRLLAERPYVGAVVIAILAVVGAVAVAGLTGHPIRDPDRIGGPAPLRLPAIVFALFLLDLLPRAVRRSAGWRALAGTVVRVSRERWPRPRIAVAAVGLVAFYLTYVSYRNLKGLLPFARDGLADSWLLELDSEMVPGETPAAMLHDLLGTGIAAHVLSTVYVSFLIFVPVSLGFALVWSRDLRRGFWFVTALGLNWVIGAASYYALPSLGPVFVVPGEYADLPATATSRLQDELLLERREVLASPELADAAQSIAGFASLHIAVVFTAALVATSVGLHRHVCRGLWAYLALTSLATVYFGWHYLVDDFAGLAIGLTAAWLGAKATGHRLRLGTVLPAVLLGRSERAGVT